MKKSNRLFARLVLAAASLAVGVGAQAQSGLSPGHSYIGLGAGQSDFSLTNGTGLFASDKRDTAYNVNVGTYFNSNVGVELGYTDFGQVDRAGGRTKADGFNLSLLGRLPLNASFNLMGRLGTTYAKTEVTSAAGAGVAAGSERDFGWSYGVGAEFIFHPQWSAVLQYEEHDLKFPGGDRDRISAATLSARYRF